MSMKNFWLTYVMGAVAVIAFMILDALAFLELLLGEGLGTVIEALGAAFAAAILEPLLARFRGPFEAR